MIGNADMFPAGLEANGLADVQFQPLIPDTN
jgi:hypothetical protein